MRTNNLLTPVINELVRLNIEYTIVDTLTIDFIVFNCKHTITAGMNDSDYTLFYTTNNGNEHTFTNQGWYKLVEGKHTGIQMYFTKVEDNMNPKSKYYSKVPIYTNYQTYGAEIHDKLQQAYRSLGEASKHTTFMREELVSYKAQVKAQEEEIEALRMELSKYKPNEEGVETHTIQSYTSILDDN